MTNTPASPVTPATPPPTRPAPTPAAPATQTAAPILAGYYPGWGASRYPVSAIPADQLTQVLYAFAAVSADGQCTAEDPAQDEPNFQALAQLKQAHPPLEVLISVGGWGGSALFSDVAATAPARARFAVTIAAPAGPSEYGHLHRAALCLVRGPGAAASPYAQRRCGRAGLPGGGRARAQAGAGHVVLRARLAGRAAANAGLYQPDTGPAPGTYADDGVFSYADLESNYLPTFTRHFQPEAKVPWLYSPAEQIFISYDDPESLGYKADYALAHGLGGMMFWELSLDDAQHSLVSALHVHLNP